MIDWRDRVAITVANGAGSPPCWGALLGAGLPLDEGNRALGPGGVGGRGGPGQGRCSWGRQPLLTAFGTEVPSMVPAETRTLLANFGLTAAHVLRPGGEPFTW